MYLSVIIPIYNAENFLRRCLDSILAQGMEEYGYEVIMVNDGSTDNSVQICEEYCERYSHFRLLNQQNSGVSAARNYGIEEAKGIYIVFVDADDYLLDEGYGIIFGKLIHRDDIDVVSFKSSYDFWEKKPIDDTIVLDGNGHDLIQMRGIVSFCWLFAYKKDFLDKNRIRFSNYIVGEDQLFTATVLLANPRVVATKADIYRYVVHDSSATTKRSVSHTRKCVVDYLDSYADIMGLLNRYGIDDDSEVYSKCVAEMNFKKMFGFSRMLSSEYSSSEYHSIMTKCKRIGFYPVVSVQDGLRNKAKTGIMNLVMRNFFMYKVCACIFNGIITPYVMPRLRSNL